MDGAEYCPFVWNPHSPKKAGGGHVEGAFEQTLVQHRASAHSGRGVPLGRDFAALHGGTKVEESRLGGISLRFTEGRGTLPHGLSIPSVLGIEQHTYLVHRSESRGIQFGSTGHAAQERNGLVEQFMARTRDALYRVYLVASLG